GSRHDHLLNTHNRWSFSRREARGRTKDSGQISVALRYAACQQNWIQYSASAMHRFVRPFLMILVAVAVSVTSSGWNMATAKGAFPAGSSQGVQSTMGAEHVPDHHGAGAASGVGACSTDGDCGSQSQDTANAAACCATSCHLAVPTIAGAHDVLLAIGKSFNTKIVDLGVDDALLGRLERPPRAADV
ncbi:MAG TPA: hypothetical protein VGN75_17040, partial [Kaistia sp.]|nr:hypothetical protein [Kaistia sp.]